MKPMVQPITVLAAAGLGAVAVLGLLSRSDCLRDICIGKPAPMIAGASIIPIPGVGDRIEADLGAKAPLLGIVKFRPPYAPPEGQKTDHARLTVFRDPNGLVDRITVSVSFAEGSYLWAPDQQKKIQQQLIELVGTTGPKQAVNWMRVNQWQRDSRLRNTRITAQLWPGTAGFAAFRLDFGRMHEVERLEQ